VRSIQIFKKRNSNKNKTKRIKNIDLNIGFTKLDYTKKITSLITDSRLGYLTNM